MLAAGCSNPVGPKTGDGKKPTPNKTLLNEKITAADALFNLLAISSDGTDVLESEYWVVSAEKFKLECAIETAKFVADNARATAGEIQMALEELSAAYDEINEAKQLGTKANTLKNKLNAEIAKAEILDASLKASDDGSDIPPNAEWVTGTIKTRLGSAIARAKTAVGNDDAAELEAALTELIAAYNEANGAKEKGITPVKDALRAKITEAGSKMSGVYISEDGSEYMRDERWVSPDVHNALDKALEAAIFARDNPNATKVEVDAALLALETALNNFKPSAGISEANKKALNELIVTVTEALDNAEVSVNGQEIYTHMDWVTQQTKDNLQDVLDKADSIAKNKESLQSEVDSMAAELKDALNTFNNEKQKGKLTSGSIDYTFKGPEDEQITLSAAQPLSWKLNDKLHITVTETFDSYKWYVDGAERAGEISNEITLSAREFPLGSHTLTLKVTKNGVPYTKTLKFTVIN
jgi:hypothetical protein